MVKQDKLLKFAIAFAIIYAHISFVFLYTVFQTERVGILFSLIFCAIMLFVALKRGISRVRSYAVNVPTIISLIFFIYMGGYNIVDHNYSIAFVYIGLFLALVIANNLTDEPRNAFSLKMMTAIEMLFWAGILFEMLFPGAYSRIMESFLLPGNYAKVIEWKNRKYFAGFTHQLATTAMFVAYGIPLVMYRKGKKSFARTVLVALLYAGLIMTGKRMLLLAAIIAPLIVAACAETQTNKNLKRITVYIIISIIALTLIYRFSDKLIMMGGSIKRITKSIIGSDLDITSGRLPLWKAAIAMFKDAPVFGSGIGQYIVAASMGTEAHNAYLQLLAETGIIGLLLFLMVLAGNFLYTARKLRASQTNNEHLKISLYFQILYILYSFTGNTVTSVSSLMIYFLFCALSFVEPDSECASNTEDEDKIINAYTVRY